MNEQDWLTNRFEENRNYIHSVAFRMLGSDSEADDAVQETWLRLSRSGSSDIENLRGWLRTVVARVCLDMLRSRKARSEEILDADLLEKGLGRLDVNSPEHEALLADSVGLALLIVLEKLTPAERLAFVLHDIFAVPFEEIAPIVERSPAAARQLASRARRRVKGATSGKDVDLSRQREVVKAFLAAVRQGDFAGLLALLDTDVLIRADRMVVPPGGLTEVRGALAAAEQSLTYSQRARFGQLAIVDGGVGIVLASRGRVVIVLTFKISGEKIGEIDVIADPARLSLLNLVIL